MAYFYCDISDAKKRTVTDILRSLVVSLLAWQPSNLSILGKTYEDCMDGQSKPSNDKLQEVLREFISGFQKAYILIDALDECLDIEKVLEFVEALHGYDLQQCQLLVTGRKEQQFVDTMLSTKPMEVDMSQMPIKDDIKRYIDYSIQSSSELRRWGPDEKALIIKALEEKANGM
jgi:hypothetical protein